MVSIRRNGDQVPASYVKCDVALVGGGIMSATFGTLISLLEPTWTIRAFERLGHTAKESSDPWNNAGTGHAALCELNYTKENADGTVDISKAVNINDQFQVSRQFWAHLLQQGVLSNTTSFINATPHMTFVHGQDNVAYLRRRWDALKVNPLFASMEYSDDPAVIGQWAPLITEGRDPGQRIATTYDPTGTDINFGEITRQFFSHIESKGGHVSVNHEVEDLKQDPDGGWLLRVHNSAENEYIVVKAKYVFVGAGGYALKVLQKAGLPEVDGYALFPVTGQFLTTNDPAIEGKHGTKVYGKASLGAPPMSVPHLDARVINGGRWVLFGPFAGINPRYLQRGSVFDLPSILRPHNIKPMLEVGRDNLDLVKYLVQQVMLPLAKKGEDLQVFMPTADVADWRMVNAGQRAQIIKKNAQGVGSLEFGTEVIISADKTIAGILGASPGASVSVPILLNVLQKSFPQRMAGWKSRLEEIVPTFGTTLISDPDRAREVMRHTAEVLNITPPNN